MIKIITIDCDEVLAETMDAILEFVNYEIDGKPIHRNDLMSHDLDQIKKYHMSFDERVANENKLFHVPTAIERIKPVAGAKEKLEEFKNAGYILYVVTGRGESLRGHTQQWLQTYFPDLIDDILFAGTHTDQPVNKSDLLKKVNSQMMIDDEPRYISDLAKLPITTYMISRPWNKDFDVSGYTNIKKVNGWGEIEIVI